MVDFGDAERNIQNYFSIGAEVVFADERYTVNKIGKPTCQEGEPKTDIYILLVNGNNEQEIKISFKKDNADFLENKIKAERAEQLFGTDWQSVIESSTAQMKDKFLAKPLIYKTKFKRTEKGAITLGWKFELMNKQSGELSERIRLNSRQIYDVYAGANLADDKKHATVNDEVIAHSGVANYMLIGSDVNSAQDVINKMITIEQYAQDNPDIYFACKALNYRTFKKVKEPYDGDRPLAVQIKWTVENDKLTPNLIFHKPLNCNGKAVAQQLVECMQQLGIKTTDDLNKSNAVSDCIIE